MADQEVLSISIDPGDSSAKALELKKRLEELGKESEDLAKSFKSGAVGIVEHIANQEALAKKVAATTAAYEKQVAAIQKAATQTVAVNAGAGGAGSSPAGGNKGLNTALLQGGRMAQDVQYGFGAITNNLIEIAPALGVAALLIDGITKNSDVIADKFKGWSEALKDSNREMADLATQGEAFFRSFNFDTAGSWWSSFASGLTDASKLKDLLSRSATNPFGIAGAIVDTKWVNPAGDAQKAREAKEAEAGRSLLDGAIGKDAEDRIKSLKDTIKEAGPAFGEALFRGEGKESRDSIARMLNRAATTGDEGAFGAIQARLMKSDPTIGGKLESNMPEFKEEAKRQQKKLDEAARLQEEQIKRKAKDEDDYAKLVDDEFDQSQRKYQQSKAKRGREMTGRAKDALDEMDGLRGNASLSYAQYLASGGSAEVGSALLANRIQAELEARGIESGVAGEQATDYARGIRRDVGNRISQAGMMANREALNRPAMFGLADANRLAQEAGPKVQEEQRDLLKVTVDHLAAIRGAGFPAVVGP